MQGRSRSGWYQALIVLVIMAGSFAAALLVRQFRILEPLEFRAYDLFINLQPRALTNSTVVIIEITEADIQDPELQLDYPIWDNKLADLLQLLLAHNPAAIGLDLFRDIPVPRSGEYAQQLQEVFRTNDKIVATWKLPTEGESTGIPPPPVLRDRPSRLGFGDFPFDDKLDKMVRRGLLYASDGNNSYESLALQTALLFLANKGIVPEPLDDPMAFQLGKSTLRRIDKNHGCYINTDANGYQILLDFRGPLRFERRRYKEIVSGKLPMGAFYDRILLVGYTAESVRDELATPLRENQRGIEVQAQVVDQLLRAALHGDRPMAAWKEWEELAWIAVWCLLGGLVSARVRSAKWFCFWVSVPLPALFLVAWGLYRAGWWVPLAVPAFAFLLPVGTIAAWSVYRERALLKELRQWFESLVSPEIVEKVLDSPELYVDPQTGLPVPQNAIATVIFADLKGSVAIAE
jgi:adenylate cyclase